MTLALRRGTVVEAGDLAPVQRLVVEVGAERRPALCDTGLLGGVGVGEEVLVNTAALDLRLGSGGHDVVHARLAPAAVGDASAGHVLKLNYTSLQHPVAPVDGEASAYGPVAVGFLHGQLAPLAWAYARARPGGRLGYVQTAGGALPGAWSETVRELRLRGLLAGHLTAGASYGGADGDAISLAGALGHGFGELGWDAAVVLPGPGIVGSDTRFGHGGMQALDSIHTAAALGCAVVVAPRRSDADPRARHRGLSHHARTVLELALVPVTVAGSGAEPGLERHAWHAGAADLAGYGESGLSTTTMGRADPAFFAAALAAGSILGTTGRQ